MEGEGDRKGLNGPSWTRAPSVGKAMVSVKSKLILQILIIVNDIDDRIHRLVYSMCDFAQASSALTFLDEECDLKEKYSLADRRRFKCYENQAIVSFGRPFSASRGRPILSLNFIGVRFNKKERRLKKELIDLRNKVVAHSDIEKMHYRVDMKSFFKDDSVSMPMFTFDEGLFLNQNQRWIFREILNKLQFGIYERAFHLAQEFPEKFDFYKERE